jgi:hypothetical protein
MNVKVFRSEMGIPLIELSGEVIEKTGAELADKIMREIYVATGDHGKNGYPAEMSLRFPIIHRTAAPRDEP